MSVPRQIFKPINFLIPKRKNTIYAMPHTNCMTDLYDFLNYGSDNLLCLINYLFCNYEGDANLKIYLECYDISRISVVNEYLLSNPNPRVKIILIPSYLQRGRKPSICRRLKNMLVRYSCKIWMSDTGFCYFQDKLYSQKYVCLDYSTPFKSNFGIDWKTDYSSMDGFFQTSLLTAQIDSANFRAKIENCVILGYPRNDTLFNSKKTKEVDRWIKSKVCFNYKKIIVYAPTYRDYEVDYSNKCIFGYDFSTQTLEKWLSENEILVITKLHPLQQLNDELFTPHIIKYEKSYEYSLYDLLNLSDVLISDYSSVIHDYVLTDKKIIMNFFDRDTYEKNRGFVFDPIDYICPGPIVTDMSSLFQEIISDATLENVSRHDFVRDIFHRYQDSNSTYRALQYVEDSLIKK